MSTETRFAAALLGIVCAVALPWDVAALVLAGFLLSTPVWFARSSDRNRLIRRFLRTLAYLIGVAVVVLVVNLLLVQGGDALRLPGGIILHENGWVTARQVIVRLLGLSTALLLFFLSTGPRGLAAFLRSVGAPRTLADLLLLALHFIEEIPARIRRILTAQEARGARVRGSIFARGRALISVVGPLVVSSIVESVDRRVGLEVRGYHLRATSGGVPQRNAIVRSPMAVLFLALAGLVIVWRFGTWLMR